MIRIDDYLSSIRSLLPTRYVLYDVDDGTIVTVLNRVRHEFATTLSQTHPTVVSNVLRGDCIAPQPSQGSSFTVSSLDGYNILWTKFSVPPETVDVVSVRYKSDSDWLACRRISLFYAQASAGRIPMRPSPFSPIWTFSVEPEPVVSVSIGQSPISSAELVEIWYTRATGYMDLLTTTHDQLPDWLFGPIVLGTYLRILHETIGKLDTNLQIAAEFAKKMLGNIFEIMSTLGNKLNKLESFKQIKNREQLVRKS